MYGYHISEHFKKQLKGYAKKHRSLLNDVVNTLKKFKKQSHISLGADTYKIRVKATGLQKGKRDSFRLIVLVLEINNLITPITIYFKGDRKNLSKKEILYHIEKTNKELET